MNSITNQIALSDSEIQASFAALGCDVDISGEYGEPDRFTVTQDTLADFLEARRHWSKPGALDQSTDRHLVLRDVAPRKGDPRADVYVIDFGAVRLVCKY